MIVFGIVEIVKERTNNMDAKKCDRCGNFYDIVKKEKCRKKIESCDSEVFRIVTKYFENRKSSMKFFDLCPKCQNEFDEFVKAKMKGELSNE